MCAGDWLGSLLACEQQLRGLKGQISAIFCCSELWETAPAFLDGVLSGDRLVAVGSGGTGAAPPDAIAVGTFTLERRRPARPSSGLYH